MFDDHDDDFTIYIRHYGLFLSEVKEKEESNRVSKIK